MQEEFGKIDGDEVVSHQLALYGMLTGNAVVEHGGLLLLHGMICGDLRIEAGGEAIVHGTVAGRVTCAGRVEVHGVVGSIVELDGAEVHVATSSIVAP